MNKVLWSLVLVLALAGCGKQEAATTQPSDPAMEQAHQMLLRGTVFLKQGDALKAVEQFAEAVKTAPNYSESYFILGETFLNLKQFPQAVAVMSAAAQKFPDNGLAYYLLAVGEEGMGQKLPAIMAARRSVELFNAAKDPEGIKRSSILLAVMIQAAKQETADQAAATVAADAQKTLEKSEIPVGKGQ